MLVRNRASALFENYLFKSLLSNAFLMPEKKSGEEVGEEAGEEVRKNIVTKSDTA